MAYSAKRKHLRTNATEAVRIVSVKGVEYGIYDDLSAGGLRLSMDHEMDLGAELRLSFSIRLPSDQVVSIERAGIVVRCAAGARGYHIGVRFTAPLHEEFFLGSKTVLPDLDPGPF